jgi:hypothetical protein
MKDRLIISFYLMADDEHFEALSKVLQAGGFNSSVAMLYFASLAPKLEVDIKLEAGEYSEAWKPVKEYAKQMLIEGIKQAANSTNNPNFSVIIRDSDE